MLTHYGNWDFQQAYNLPLKLREWWVERILREKQIEQQIANGNPVASAAPSAPASAEHQPLKKYPSRQPRRRRITKH